VIQGQPTIVASASAGTCDPDNAYDPDDPCSASGSCDADTAYNPDSPCTPAQAPQIQPPQVETAEVQPAPAAAQPDCGSSAVFNPACPASVIASVESAPPPSQPASYRPAATPQNWGIQVGAFENAGLAQTVAQNALNQLASVAANATVAVSPTTPFGGNILYQARLIHLSAQQAVQACSALNQRQLPCVVVQPSNV
jgi:cell division septation protein DedD